MSARKRNAASFAERSCGHSVSDGGPPPTLLERIHAKAEEQWGVLEQPQLVELGLLTPAITRWTKAGRLHRPYRGVYTLAPPKTLAPQGQELAAVWGCGGDAVLCGASAAIRWGMLRRAPKTHHVLVKSTGRRSPKGVRLHVTTDLPDDDRTVWDKIPITTVERTILDLAADRTLSDRAVESAAAQAERDGWLRRPAQLRVAGRTKHRTGAARLRTILRIGPRLWRSDEEQQAAIAIVAAGLPEPKIAHEIVTDIGKLEVDLSFPDHRLILEVDGGQHALPLNQARDADRGAALERLGWVTVRVTAELVRTDDRAVVAIVKAALEQRSRARGPG